MPRVPRPWHKGKTTYIRLFGCTLKVSWGDTEEWVRHYEELRGRAKNLLPVFQRYGSYLLESIERNFQAQGRPERWAPLNPLYAARKAKKWPGRGILEASGAMRRGFEYYATPQTLKIRNAARWWWIVHQKGTTNLFGRGIRLPARVMVIMQRADKGVFTRWARRYILTGTV